MSPVDAVAATLVAAGALVLAASSLALLVVRDTRARLHLVGPPAVVGAPLVVLGLAVDEGPSRAALKLLLVGAVVAVSGPLLTTATAYALRRHREDA